MSVSQPTIDQLIDALRPVQDPELNRSIVDLGMVRDVVIDKKGTVGLTVVLTIAGCPLRNEIQTRVNTALRNGQPAIVSTTVSPTVPFLSMTTSRTMPKSTMDRFSSGSCTGRKASISWSMVGCDTDI